MIAPLTLSQRLAAARIIALMPAIEATLTPLFADTALKILPGKIDISDVIAGAIFMPPMIGLAITRVRVPVEVDGSWSLPVELAAYIVTEDMAIGTTSVSRQDVGWAIALGLVEILTDLDVPRWGLQSIGSPSEIEARPMFSSEVFAKGSAYYAVTWRQALLGFGTDPLARVPVTTVEAVEDGVVATYPPELEGWPV